MEPTEFARMHLVEAKMKAEIFVEFQAKPKRDSSSMLLSACTLTTQCDLRPNLRLNLEKRSLSIETIQQISHQFH